MTRRAARTDENHARIRDGLRAFGATVADTSRAGAGFPDLVVGYHGANFLLEVKDGSKPPSRRVLTDDQREFHVRWRGQVHVVCELDQAIGILRRYT